MKRLTAILLALLLLLPLSSARGEQGFSVSSAYVINGIVCFTASSTASAYCFTKVEISPDPVSPDWVREEGIQYRVFKLDGDYFLWLMDAQGNVSAPCSVSVTSRYNYIVDAEGLRSLNTAASTVFESVEDENAWLYRNVTEAGVYTRNAVLSSAASIITIFASHGKTVPYQASGAFQGEDDWGINPEWGAKLPAPITDANGTYYYKGMQCVASLVWAYKQAGLNLSNESTGHRLGDIGAAASKGDNKIAIDGARGGDIIVNGAHYLMVFDRLDTDLDGVDDSYLTFEMRAPDLIFMVHSFRSIRYLDAYSMDAVFEDTSRVVSGARFWAGTLHIPAESWPEALTAAYSGSGRRLAARRFMTALGMNQG